MSPPPSYIGQRSSVRIRVFISVDDMMIGNPIGPEGDQDPLDGAQSPMRGSEGGLRPP
jgi:hypothetical protein